MTLCVAITCQSPSTIELSFLRVTFYKPENVPRFSTKKFFYKKKNTLKNSVEIGNYRLPQEMKLFSSNVYAHFETCSFYVHSDRQDKGFGSGS